MPLTRVELFAARNYLRHAEKQIAAARDLFLGAGDHHATAARLEDIEVRLADEIRGNAKDTKEDGAVPFRQFTKPREKKAPVAHTSKPTSNIKIEDILSAVAEHYGVEQQGILSRNQSLVRYRQIVMYLSRTVAWHSLPEIGRAFGRDHTTVLYAVRRIETLLQSDEALKAEIDLLSAQLSNRVQLRRVA